MVFDKDKGNYYYHMTECSFFYYLNLNINVLSLLKFGNHKI